MLSGGIYYENGRGLSREPPLNLSVECRVQSAEGTVVITLHTTLYTLHSDGLKLIRSFSSFNPSVHQIYRPYPARYDLLVAAHVLEAEAVLLDLDEVNIVQVQMTILEEEDKR